MIKLKPLPYAYDALEPLLSEKAMRLHHETHHKGYVDKLNTALEGDPTLLNRLGGLYEVLSNPQWIPLELKQSVIDFGGGVWNHDFYWGCLSPSPGSYMDTPEWFQTAVNNTFGGYEQLKDKLIQEGASHFGSGWVWLVLVPHTNTLRVYTTLNQNTPMMRGHVPLLTIDLWEHAHYIDYEANRKDFLTAIIEYILDWSVIPQ